MVEITSTWLKQNLKLSNCQWEIENENTKDNEDMGFDERPNKERESGKEKVQGPEHMANTNNQNGDQMN